MPKQSTSLKLRKLNFMNRDRRVEPMTKNDKYILETCYNNSIPIQISMGGGYSSILKDIIEAHSNTFRLAQEIYF